MVCERMRGCGDVMVWGCDDVRVWCGSVMM